MKQRSSSKPDTIVDTFQSPFGTLYLSFSGRVLTGIGYERPKHPRPLQETKYSLRFKKELEAYFQGRMSTFDQEVGFPEGTDFEQEVWLALRDIPYGETRSYKWLAERIGRPKATRAVGRALGRNPIPIVLPCHRVIESDGSLGGYSSGVDIKRRLLDIEYYAKQAES